MNDRAAVEPVGIIGIGALGVGIAARLINAGIGVFGPPRGRVEAFSAAGGTVLENNASVAARVSQLIVLVQCDTALAEAMADIGAVLRPDHVVLCLGTHAVAIKERAASIAESVGANFLDGEISGTPELLRNGRASILLAGNELAALSIREMLEHIVPTVTFLGAFGNAVRMKLITNYLVGIHTLAAAEALLLARRLGLDPATVVSAIAPSAGGSTMLALRGRMMAEGRLADGSMTGFVRYFDLLRRTLDESGRETAVLFELADSLYRQAIAEGHGDRDIAAIYESLDRHNTAALGTEAEPPRSPTSSSVATPLTEELAP